MNELAESYNKKMDKRTELNTKLKESLKNKDQVAISTIRLVLAAMKDRDIQARAKGNSEGITDDELLSLMQTMIKQRKESTRMYIEGDRKDLADREKAEIVVIESFLPEQMDESEMDAAISSLIESTGAASIRDMGKVMAVLKADYAGRIDMGRASGMIKEKLSDA